VLLADEAQQLEVALGDARAAGVGAAAASCALSLRVDGGCAVVQGPLLP